MSERYPLHDDGIEGTCMGDGAAWTSSTGLRAVGLDWTLVPCPYPALKEIHMRWLGVALIVLGVLGIVYGGFWYTTEDTKAEIGPLKVKVEEEKRVNVPLWVGVGAVVAGVVVVATRTKPVAG